MERVKLFQYAAIFHPSENEMEDGEKAKVIIEPSTVLAKDEQVAVLLIARQLPEAYVEKLDQIEIAIRPF